VEKTTQTTDKRKFVCPNCECTFVDCGSEGEKIGDEIQHCVLCVATGRGSHVLEVR